MSVRAAWTAKDEREQGSQGALYSLNVAGKYFLIHLQKVISPQVIPT